MKLKLFTIGLLATLVMTSTTVEASQLRRMKEAQEQVPVLQQQVAAGNHPNLDIPAHGDNATAVDDLHAKLGASVVNSGATANHRITDLHATLGHHPVGGAVNDPANKKVEDIAARLGTKARVPTGPSVHDKLTDVLALEGNVQTAAASGAHVPAEVIVRLETILTRLKAGLAANGAIAIVTTAGAPVANLALKTGRGGGAVNTIRRAADIETVLNELGW